MFEGEKKKIYANAAWMKNVNAVFFKAALTPAEPL